MTSNLLSQEGLSRAGPGKQGPSRQKPGLPLTCRGALIAHGGAGAAAVHGGGLGGRGTGATACIIHALVCFSIYQAWGTLEGSEGALRKWPTGSLGSTALYQLTRTVKSRGLGSHLGRGHTVEVLPQHPPHVFAGVRSHLVLEEEGELAAFPDAVEVAIHLVVLAACGWSHSSVSLPGQRGYRGAVVRR